MGTLSQNPLSKHFRQPALYFRLPSEGRWYPEGVLDLPVTNEIPVYPMTAKDELILKTPDALMNGAGTVQVIESCCPNIKDAWKMPAVDVDPVLLAIRLATYGNEMEFTCICPKCQNVAEKAVDVNFMLERVRTNPNWGKEIPVGDLKIVLKPQNFQELNHGNMMSFEEGKLMRVIGDEALPDEQKIIKFNEAFKKILEIGLEQISRSIEGIRMPDGSLVSEHKYIIEYLENCERSIWDTIKNELEQIRDQTDYNQIEVTCENAECGQKFTAPFVFEQSNFFA